MMRSGYLAATSLRFIRIAVAQGKKQPNTNLYCMSGFYKQMYREATPNTFGIQKALAR